MIDRLPAIPTERMMALELIEWSPRAAIFVLTHSLDWFQSEYSNQYTCYERAKVVPQVQLVFLVRNATFSGGNPGVIR